MPLARRICRPPSSGGVHSGAAILHRVVLARRAAIATSIDEDVVLKRAGIARAAACESNGAARASGLRAAEIDGVV